MVRITYVEHSGVEHEVDVPPGYSVMQGAVRDAIPGIEAECGGACACATCHVYVDESWLDRTGGAQPGEREMLDFVSGVRPNSRLSCQIKVTEDLNGLLVKMPECQR